jgi:hypothetical protein
VKAQVELLRGAVAKHDRDIGRRVDPDATSATNDLDEISVDAEVRALAGARGAIPLHALS